VGLGAYDAAQESISGRGKPLPQTSPLNIFGNLHPMCIPKTKQNPLKGTEWEAYEKGRRARMDILFRGP